MLNEKLFVIPITCECVWGGDNNERATDVLDSKSEERLETLKAKEERKER